MFERDRSSRKLSPASATMKSLAVASNPPKANTTNLLLDYTKGHTQFMGSRFIFECAHKLEAEPLTIATALVLFHRFFQTAEEKNYDIYLIGASCLYLAGKVEVQNLKIRDIINVARASIHRTTNPLDLGEAYFAFRDAIVQAELLMMRTLSFQVTIDHPHKYLVHYMKTLEEWIGKDEWSKAPIARTAWSLLQDFHHDSAVLTFTPQAMAMSALELSMLTFGCTPPLCTSEGKASWQYTFYPDFDRTINEDIMRKMLNLYEQEMEILSNLLFQENKESK